MKYQFLFILAIFVYAVWRDDLFFAGTAFSPLLIILSIWIKEFLSNRAIEG